MRKQSGPEVLKLRDWSFVGFQGFFKNMVNFYSAQSESMKGFVLKVVHLAFILNIALIGYFILNSLTLARFRSERRPVGDFPSWIFVEKQVTFFQVIQLNPFIIDFIHLKRLNKFLPGNLRIYTWHKSFSKEPWKPSAKNRG